MEEEEEKKMLGDKTIIEAMKKHPSIYIVLRYHICSQLLNIKFKDPLPPFYYRLNGNFFFLPKHNT